MGVPVINLRVVRPGERSDQLLASVAERLHRDFLRPDAAGMVPITFFNGETSVEEAWDLVYEALESSDEEWHVLVAIGQHPGPLGR